MFAARAVEAAASRSLRWTLPSAARGGGRETRGHGGRPDRRDAT